MDGQPKKAQCLLKRKKETGARIIGIIEIT
jgi:hypothetical protein